MKEHADIRHLEDADISLIPARGTNGHKGSYGKVLVVAGSEEICGAAILSAKAALRSGVGMVRICTHEINRTPIAAAFPEALLSVYSGDGPSEEGLMRDLAWADLILAGPGMSTSETAERLLHEILVHTGKPLVLDADALNLLAAHPDWWELLHAPCVITPHLVEMSRLCGTDVQAIRAEQAAVARTFAREHDLVCVLKDVRTVIADAKGGAWLCDAGNSALATAGSGDVLAGIIAGLIAQQGMFSDEGIPMAALGALVHGLCGRAASVRRSKRTVIAGDLLEEMHAFL